VVGSDRRVDTRPVHFFIEPTGVTVKRLREIDIDREWQDMRRAKERWIVQAFHRLSSIGREVTLGSAVPSGGFVVYHKEDHRVVLSRMQPGARPVLVAVRADFRSAAEADFEIVQNRHQADAQRCHFLPVWPQPGLIPRRTERAALVENVAFKGNVENLRVEIRSDEFQDFLARNGMRLLLDVTRDRNEDRPVEAAWHDYSSVDVVLAMRPATGREHTHKPATKLYNAWLAGVPAVLSSDLAFRELRRSELDYIEVSTVDEAKAALLKLRQDGVLYDAMVENGRIRGREFSAEALTRRWDTLLFETLPAMVAARPGWQFGVLARRLRGLSRKTAALVTGEARK